jgi:hypothetical protein
LAPASALQDSQPVFYYRRDFLHALQWLLDRYGDLLAPVESSFIGKFRALPPEAQALLVRLIMRKGQHFRESRISYPEIGDIKRAAGPLISLGWVDPSPSLTLDQLFSLITRTEAGEIFGGLPRNIPKRRAREILEENYREPRQFESWRGAADECVYFVAVASLCTRLRWLFFGNSAQNWSEFVLSDLGVFKYETVDFSDDSRAFHSRCDIDNFFVLCECRRRLGDGAPPAEVLAQLPPTRLNHEWLESRRSRLLLQIAREYERSGEREAALAVYLDCNLPAAWLRAIRILEAGGRHGDSHRLAICGSGAAMSDAEEQTFNRVLGRLEHRLGLTPRAKSRPPRPDRIELVIPEPATDTAVEFAALQRVAESDAPVYYVENSLINSLFGLLCWKAVFAPISGAFFHRFHTGPADLFSPMFQPRRKHLFKECLDLLDTPEYGAVIRTTFREKQGIQSPFVSWGMLTEPLLDAALACIPAAHLRWFCERLLSNIRDNRSGLPDLIQFWSSERRYRMIEVKGPGDRLQDNQRRWIGFCLDRQIPVAVCRVRWATQKKIAVNSPLNISRE